MVGVPIDTLLQGVTTDVTFVTASAMADTPRNLPLADLTGGRA